MLIPINDPIYQTMWEESTSIERKGQTTSSFLAASEASYRPFLVSIAEEHKMAAAVASQAVAAMASVAGIAVSLASSSSSQVARLQLTTPAAPSSFGKRALNKN
jgi:hypothetical protein